MGMSWYSPLGRVLLIDMGRAPDSSSILASSIVSFTPAPTADWGTRGGAPRESWRARAPIILARSKRVSRGGPMRTSNSNPEDDNLSASGLPAVSA